MLGLGHMRQRVVNEMHAAALPTRLEVLRDGGIQAALFELAQEAELEDGGLRGTQRQPKNLAAAFGVDARSDYCGDGYHPPVL